VNRFLASVERRIEVEHEERLAATRGIRLPGPTPGNPGRVGDEILREEIRVITRQHPRWTPSDIARECRCSPVTVRKVQRQAGLYRAPALDEFGVWRMP